MKAGLSLGSKRILGLCIVRHISTMKRLACRSCITQDITEGQEGLHELLQLFALCMLSRSVKLLCAENHFGTVNRPACAGAVSPRIAAYRQERKEQSV